MTTATKPPADQRLTKLRRTRRCWDYIVAAHHHFGPRMGRRQLAHLFNMPPSTVRNILRRVDRDDPEVRHAAQRFGLVKINTGGLPSEKKSLGPALDLSDFQGRV